MNVLLLIGGEPRHLRFARSVAHLNESWPRQHTVLWWTDNGDINEVLPDQLRWRVSANLQPDVIFVYGTGKLGPELVRAAPHVLNFHGGDPERYRGLDSHWWAAYHRDWDALQLTLHYVDDGLDTGDIVFQTLVPLDGVDGLSLLRERTADECVRLAKLALAGLELGGLPRRRQRERGRYYSRFPESLRGVAENSFADYVGGLRGLVAA